MGCIMDDAEREAEAAGTTVAREEEDQASAVPSSTESGLRKECTELNERYLRLVADFENFRRRTAKERESVAALATERLEHLGRRRSLAATSNGPTRVVQEKTE